MKQLIIIVVAFLLGNNSYCQIKVSADKTAAALAQKLAGQGVTISNPTLKCKGRANGFFSATGSNLGLDSGIVLTNGCAATQNGFSGVDGVSAYFASANNNMPGDAMLTPLAGKPTFDACSLEFDVVPNGDSIRFNYVFSSEEYISAVCGSYNDAFAFFISGPGITGTDNMALVPGTDIPVTINSINNGIPGSSGSLVNCTAMGPGSPFTTYYIDNTLGGTLTHQGLTRVLQAKHNVVPCNSYHLKLVIADAGNATYDSGVFLKAGSLATSSYVVRAISREGKDTTEAFCVRGCAPGKFVVRRSLADTKPQTIRFITGGDAISGLDYTPLPDSVVIPANSSSAEVVVNGLPTVSHSIKALRLFILYSVPCTGSNNISDSATMVIYDTIHISRAIDDTAICGGDSIQLSVGGDDVFSYNWSPIDGLSNSSLREPMASPLATTTYTVTVSLPGTTCTVKQEEVRVSLKLTPVVMSMADTTICRNTLLKLDATTSIDNDYYSYSWSGPSVYSSTLFHPVVSVSGAASAGIYTIKVRIDTNGCIGTASTKVNVIVPPEPVVTIPRIYCKGYFGDRLAATGENLLWYGPASDTGSIFAPYPATKYVGDYLYYVSQTIGGCESQKSAVEVVVKECCNGVVIIPTAFTPNNDGRNDVFRIVTGYGYRVDRFFVYNRWGQEVYSGLDGSWDGTFNGNALDAGTYYYTVVLGCIVGGTEVRQGDVTLIR